MNFVMTGHMGLIGSFLKKRLEDNGDKCVLGVDLRDGKDICYDFPLEKCKADIVFHLASNCKINKCISDPEWCFENVLGIHKVLEFCRSNNIKKIVSFSSSRVLSSERNPYTASKIYLEELCKAYSACYGIEYIIIRPSTVYGPFDDYTSRLIDIWIRAAIDGEDLKIYGDPETKTLDFTFIDDFIDGIMLILKKDKWNESYDISGGEEVLLNDLAKLIIRETGGTSKVKVCEKEKQQPQEVSLDISKMKDIGYNPKVKIYKGVIETIRFYNKLKD